ncbi:Hpt domain-containing protein, partial [Vibrio sp. 10N.261.45.F1]
LQAACEQRDLEAIKQVAHKMKGAAKMVGTEDIANQLQTMELVSLSDLDGIQAHYDNLEQLTNQLKTYCSESIKPFKELP